jgi:hypothetical protein
MKWLRQYGVWLTLGLAVLVWELLGVKRVKAALAAVGIPVPAWLDHESLSALEWRLPLAGRLAVDAFLVDLIVHFTFQTPLIPGL